MDEFEDPLDLLDDDGDGVIEVCLLEEEEKHEKRGGNSNSGCCFIFLALGSSTFLSIWGITKIIT